MTRLSHVGGHPVVQVEHPLSTYQDFALRLPAQWGVATGTTSTLLSVYWLLGIGWTVSRSGDVMSAMQWCTLRWFDSWLDAEYLLRLLQSGEVPPEDLFTHRIPSRDSGGVVVETVADIHRGMGRRR